MAEQLPIGEPPTITDGEPGRPASTPTAALRSDLARIVAALAAAAQPRPGDNTEAASLRRFLRDTDHLSRVLAVVERWPPLTAEQQDTLAPILNPQRRTP
jgi:hypothetical protein